MLLLVRFILLSLLLRDINIILNYIEVNKEKLINTKTFEAICIPGLTEDYKLNLFIHYDKAQLLKLIYISQDNNQELWEELHKFAEQVFEEFEK